MNNLYSDGGLIMRKVGIIFECVNDIADKELAKLLSELGFSATFTSTMTKERHFEVANALAPCGIEYETIHAPFDGINNIWYDNEEGEKMLADLKDCVDKCVISGAPIIVVHLSSGVNAPKINDLGMGRFEDLIEYAQKNNVRVAFENQRKLANLSWALEYHMAEQNVGFCWDCGHEACFTPGREYMPIFGDRLICTHIHDNMGIYNQDDHMLPFDGNIDFEKFARHIRNSGFEGSLMLEVFKMWSPIYANISSQDFIKKAYNVVDRLRNMIDGKA